MEPTKKTARIAGIIYLVLILTGIFSLLYVPSKIIVWDDPTATVDNIQNFEFTFRMGIVSNLICFTCFIILPLALYKLLGKVNKSQAMLMVIFAIISVPISYLNIAHHIDVLDLIGNEMYLDSLSVEQRNMQVMSYLESFENGTLVAHIFWGLWLFPFGYLVYKSGYLPKFFGIMLMLGCFGYLTDFLGYFLFEGYGKTLISTIAGIPASLGEIGICLWLLIIGIKSPKIKKTVEMDGKNKP